MSSNLNLDSAVFYTHDIPRDVEFYMHTLGLDPDGNKVQEGGFEIGNPTAYADMRPWPPISFRRTVCGRSL
jgi:hypothetical protein